MVFFISRCSPSSLDDETEYNLDLVVFEATEEDEAVPAAEPMTIVFSPEDANLEPEEQNTTEACSAVEAEAIPTNLATTADVNANGDTAASEAGSRAAEELGAVEEPVTAVKSSTVTDHAYAKPGASRAEAAIGPGADSTALVSLTASATCSNAGSWSGTETSRTTEPTSALASSEKVIRLFRTFFILDNDVSK